MLIKRPSTANFMCDKQCHTRSKPHSKMKGCSVQYNPQQPRETGSWIYSTYEKENSSEDRKKTFVQQKAYMEVTKEMLHNNTRNTALSTTLFLSSKKKKKNRPTIYVSQ